MKIKFIINGNKFNDIEMSSPPQVGNYVTCGQVTTEVKEVEYELENNGYLIRAIVRCVGDLSSAHWQPGVGPT